MNVYFLHKSDGSRSGYCACGECGSIALDANIDVMEKCCTCWECGVIIPKSERFARNTHYHRECERIRDRRIQSAAIDKAELVPEYTGPVHFDCNGGSFGEGYFSDVEEFAEWLDEQDEEEGFVRPRFVFCCEEYPFKGLDIGSLLENACEDMYEDAQDDLDGADELSTAVDVFNKANSGRISFYEDRKHKVAVPAAVPA